MTLEVSTSEAFHAAVAEAKQRGQRILTLKRGKQGNASWVLRLSDVEQPTCCRTHGQRGPTRRPSKRNY